jgi:iron(III) transport system permease protein
MRAGSNEAQPVRLHGRRAALAWTVCALPVLFGFVLPVLFMLRPLVGGWDELPWSSFLQWSRNSLWLAGLSAALATVAALALAFAVRMRTRATHARRGAGGQPGLRRAGRGDCGGPAAAGGLGAGHAPGSSVGYWVTATVLGIVWAYLVRFTAVALQSVQSGYARIPGSLDDSARMLGTTGLGLAVRVHWPLLRRSTAAAALLVFVDVMKELPATLVLRPSTATRWPWSPTSWRATSAWARLRCPRSPWCWWVWCR